MPATIRVSFGRLPQPSFGCGDSKPFTLPNRWFGGEVRWAGRCCGRGRPWRISSNGANKFRRLAGFSAICASPAINGGVSASVSPTARIIGLSRGRRAPARHSRVFPPHRAAKQIDAASQANRTPSSTFGRPLRLIAASAISAPTFRAREQPRRGGDRVANRAHASGCAEYV